MVELLSKLFVKNHQNTTDGKVRASYGTMVSIVGIVLNLLLSAAKLTVGALFGALFGLGAPVYGVTGIPAIPAVNNTLLLGKRWNRERHFL